MKLKTVSLSCFLILVVASFTIASGSAEADEGLQSRITSTERKIESLNKEVEQLREELNIMKEILETTLTDNYAEGSRIEYGDEAGNTSISSALSAAREDEADRSNKPKWEKRENWRKLQRGMSKDEVKRILGEPEQISVDMFGGESWDYPGIGDHVSIAKDGRLSSWGEPDWSMSDF